MASISCRHIYKIYPGNVTAVKDFNLEMIAGLCGFSGANYLCRVFKRETGLSPAAWRETAAHKAVVQKLPARNNEIYV